ncbi:hypothetical protein QAD02_010513 [Eretmocerus hayati]|uniref:Uncharacterized protein n=1 Tax=Eretmocerus hayati TaxID=131215 RepID=A0ACC2NWY5_9HYME|nr:hypothetical protein QAD02_010513 [Eretmocerus hayati]
MDIDESRKKLKFVPGMELVKPVRNPYPVPDLSKEGRWIAGGPVLGRNVHASARRWYSDLEPHERLFSHQTLNSARKDCRYRTTKAPNDSLDLMLASVYVHDRDLFLPKPYVFIQPESINKETWRLLRNQIKCLRIPRISFPLDLGRKQNKRAKDKVGKQKFDRGKRLLLQTYKKPPPALGHEIKYAYTRPESTKDMCGKPRERIHPSSLQLAIEGPHNDRTNPGFSRKIDGTYYGI